MAEKKWRCPYCVGWFKAPQKPARCPLCLTTFSVAVGSKPFAPPQQEEATDG